MQMQSYYTLERYQDSARAFHEANQQALMEWFAGQKIAVEPTKDEKEKTWVEKMAVGFRLMK